MPNKPLAELHRRLRASCPIVGPQSGIALWLGLLCPKPNRSVGTVSVADVIAVASSRQHDEPTADLRTLQNSQARAQNPHTRQEVF